MGSIDKEIQLDSMVFIRDYGFRRCFTPEYQSGTTSQTAAQFGTTASEGASRLILLRCRINVSKEKTLDTCEADM